jgi:tetratricopeptide (TPR) repeat protein
VVLALAVAVPLVAAALPRFVAGLLVDRHEIVFYHLEQGREVEAYDRMWSAVAGYEAALDWSDDPLLHQRLAQLYLAVARDPTLAPDRRLLLLNRSIEHQRAALAGAPADSYAWIQLALALFGTEGATPAFERAYRRSIETAPHAPALATTRALLGLRAWPRLGPDTQALVGAQVALAVAVDARALVGQMISQGERRLALSLLVQRPAELSRLQEALSPP